MSEVLTDVEWRKPLPQPAGAGAAYWEAAANGTLLVQECPTCGHRQLYPRALCTSCGGDPGWITASGRGTVHTFTVIRQMGMPGFREELPYVVAMVELDEGPLLMGNVTGCDPDDVRIGMPVEVYFVRVEDAIGIPLWRAAGRPTT